MGGTQPWFCVGCWGEEDGQMGGLTGVCFYLKRNGPGWTGPRGLDLGFVLDLAWFGLYNKNKGPVGY